MKLYSFFLLMLLSLPVVAQIQQNINKNSGTVSNNIATIDSIRFNGSSTNMEVVLQNGTVESHAISDIINVNFVSVTQHSCGADSIHNPNLSYGSMTDQDGNTYKTIVIGAQEWMAENLMARTYRNGLAIPLVTDATTWGGLSTAASCWYNNDSATYACPYGRLYNWYAAASSNNVCPAGWHVPTDAEWSTLINHLDPNADGGNTTPNNAGGKMRSTGTQYWLSPNTYADNSSGFSGLPGGLRYLNGTFIGISNYGYWWSSTEFFTSFAWFRQLIYGISNVGRTNDYKTTGYSVRCLRD